MTQSLPSGLKYGTVRWTTVAPAADSADPDNIPDAAQINGKVTFSANITKMKYLGNGIDTVPRTILFKPIPFTLVNGVLTDADTVGDIMLVASTGQQAGTTSPEDGTWNWHVEYALDDGYTFDAFDFQVVADEVVDLTLVMPEIASDGVAYVTGPIGPQGPAGTGGDGTGGTVSDATTTTKGVIRLSGDLAGTADTPTVPGLADKAAVVHTHASTDISDSTAIGRSVLTSATQSAARSAIGAGTSSLTLGVTSSTAAAGNDSRFSDARTPLAHAASHATVGNDPISPASIGASATGHTHGVADLTATGTKSGTTFLRGDNTWATPPDTNTTYGPASETASGIVELATAAETTTGADSTRAVHPAGLKVELDKKAPTVHTHTSANITDLTESVQDIVGALIVAGVGTTVSYDDVAGTVTINATGGTGGSTDPEIVRDVIGSALVAGSGVQITLNDAGDTITIASTAVLPTRSIIAGTGLTGGGDLSADRTLAVAYGTAAGTAAQGNDSRLFDARTPLAHTHATTDINGSTVLGRQLMVIADAAAARTAIGAGTGNSNLVIGTTSTTAKAGDYAPPADPVATTAGTRTLGTGAQQAAAGNHNHDDRYYTEGETDLKLAERAPLNHTHASTDIVGSTTTGRSLIAAADASSARSIIGAGTSSLALGTTAGTAKAGDYQPTAANISDSTTVGRSVLTAATAATARSAIGAGTGSSDLVIGTTSTTAKAGNYAPTAEDISNASAIGRTVLKAADAAAVRAATGAGRVDSDGTVLSIVKLTQAQYDALATKVATTLYAIVG